MSHGENEHILESHSAKLTCAYLCSEVYTLIAWLQVFPLYKLEHPTVLCCSAYIRYMHCGPDIRTAGLSVMITPGPQAINQLKHPSEGSGGIHALRPRASCMYTSQIPHWGVLTNT